MVATIYNIDTVEEIANKIYNTFEVMCSCRIHGFVQDDVNMKMIPKGQAVLKLLEKMYEEEYMRINGTRKERKHTFRPNSIGGPIAHKIFTWELRVVDDEPRVTIWRYQ